MSDFKYEYNDNGTWQNALCTDSHDENNKAFVYVSSDDSTWHTTGVVSKGDEAGQFRAKT